MLTHLKIYDIVKNPNERREMGIVFFQENYEIRLLLLLVENVPKIIKFIIKKLQEILAFTRYLSFCVLVNIVF